MHQTTNILSGLPPVSKRYYNVIKCDQTGTEGAVHVQWKYPLAVRLRNDRKKEYPHADYYISLFIAEEFTKDAQWKRTEG